jgi:hypothetical protein
MSDTEIQTADAEAPVVENVIVDVLTDDLDEDHLGDDVLDDDVLDDDVLDDDVLDDDVLDEDDLGEDLDDVDPDEDLDEYEDVEHTGLVLREVIERQLIACRALSTQVTDAATDVTVTLVESPARVIAAVREGATLPSAFGLTTDTVADAAMEAGSRIRAAVGTYLTAQAALPNALISGTAEVAGSAVRAQGALASSAFDAAFTVATAVSRGADVRDSLDEEWNGLVASVASARDDVEDAWFVAQQRVWDALPAAD